MGQQSLIYSFVARGTVILAEFTEFTGNFMSIAAQCLQKLPATNNKFTYNCDGHTFNYLVDNGFSIISFLSDFQIFLLFLFSDLRFSVFSML
uniref:Longin domain-containing protein n=1 Tax=Rhizophora mucronata TaxID=61149 RepID=A0A2P2LS36_RHIMU